MPFRKILVANRGEIAVRILRACRELGIQTVAVHSEADVEAYHVGFADEAVACGPAPVRESYLDGARLIEIARSTGAEAIHPGYGLLSEQGDFAAACEAAGLVFVGPRSETIRTLGDKVQARRAMDAAGIPIVPGATEALSDDDARALARALGYPVMVKALAGGGGRGLRRVAGEADLAGSLERARSEAERSFGDARVYLEKALEHPRHLEVQILGDAHGQLIHLFERDCSIQRRHQKLIEEAPAPGISPRLREDLGQAAVAGARSVGYRGVGTVEFLLDAKGSFHFLEMNTRIQVEHPVTEMITGVDLIEWSIRVAAGERVGIAQRDVGLLGAAIECRIYAEDPERGFLPQPGVIERFRLPGGPGVRVDSGVEAGSEISTHYDALLCKLVCWGRDRDAAIRRTRRALSELEIEGVRTTLPFHGWVLAHPDFERGAYDAQFVEAKLMPERKAISASVAAGRAAESGSA